MKSGNFSKDQLKAIKEIIRRRFKDSEGNPFDATDGQAEIFGSIVSERFNRITIKAVTQYGKSLVTALALIYLAARTSKRILIIAPRAEQARIIMGYVIEHTFDHEYFQKLIEIEGSIERFRRERSKNRIDWKTGATIRILTADVTTVSKEAKNLMGFGAEMVVVDESSLIPDSMFSKILRMVGGVRNGKLVQLGNPFEKNHFWKSFTNPRYLQLNIDYRQAIKENRMTQEFVDEAREEMDPREFQIFYECTFPTTGEDNLIPISKIEDAVNRNVEPTATEELGGDVARHGNDKTVAIIRSGAKVCTIQQWGKKDTMETVGLFRQLITKSTLCKIDVIGIGAGVVDRLKEEKFDVVAVNVAEAASDKEKFANLRAELFWQLRDRFMADDIDIPEDSELIAQLSEIKYSYDSRGRLTIESKDKMKKRGLKSPDKADALALAFYSPPSERLAKIDVF